MPKDFRFTHTQAQLADYAQAVLAAARAAGASGCECEVSEGAGLSITVRRDEPETIEHNRDKGIGVTVYFGERPNARRGHASTSDFSAAAIRSTVEAAAAIARKTAVDDCAGLPEPDQLARAPDARQLDLYHPWTVSTEEAIRIARRIERAAFALSPKVSNSEGATVSAQHSQFVFANSLGFLQGYPTSRHSLSVSVIAEDAGLMQRDDWYSASRLRGGLADPVALGDYAGRRALARLGARKIATCQVPVLFEAPVATGLIGAFVSAASGGSLYRKSSFLVDALGKPVFAGNIDIEERPHEPRGLASSHFDEEGVATRTRDVVKNGVLQGYFLGSYSARKLGMQSTGSAGGNHNLVVRPTGPDLRGMLKLLGRGLFVTDMLGHGTNLLTGDYSRGAAGYWVENGEIAYPVEEVTVAGNLKEIYRGIAAVGSDTVVRGAYRCGSILVDRMTVAGN